MFQQRCLHPFSSGGFPSQSVEAASSIRYRQCHPSCILQQRVNVGQPFDRIRDMLDDMGCDEIAKLLFTHRLK
ncbi:hypothetical protein A6R71_02170 [Xanthomonas translucens pv. arrhenatheri]|nr:hypothetical protein A6R71_02170 [Xanthomonas translucens pv. arrhenatheri]